MGQLSSKLYKNENRMDFSLYQIYSPKLHERILIYYIIYDYIYIL